MAKFTISYSGKKFDNKIFAGTIEAFGDSLKTVQESAFYLVVSNIVKNNEDDDSFLKNVVSIELTIN